MGKARVENGDEFLPLGRDGHAPLQEADTRHGLASVKQPGNLPPLQALHDRDVVGAAELRDGLEGRVRQSPLAHVHNVLGDAHKATLHAHWKQPQSLVVLQVVHHLVQSGDDEAVLPRLLGVSLEALFRHCHGTLDVVDDGIACGGLAVRRGERLHILFGNKQGIEANGRNCA